VFGETVIISSGTFERTLVTDDGGAFSASNVPTPYNAAASTWKGLA
jgi:hypothetical protein